MKIYHLNDWQYWYDRKTRCWWAARFDERWYQINDAIHAYTKGEIIEPINHA